jgi:outer membrane protein TolC
MKWQRDKNALGFSTDRDNGTYRVGGFAEKYLNTPDSLAVPLGSSYIPGPGRWRFDVSAQIPLFQGLSAFGKQKRERALLEQSSFDLRRVMDSVELEVRNAYQNMLEQEKALEILKETAAISRERLKIEESLKELGKITDNELETFRNIFFEDQGQYYGAGVACIERQEELRYQMRWFEPDTGKDNE